jgi:hypothetical protein
VPRQVDQLSAQLKDAQAQLEDKQRLASSLSGAERGRLEAEEKLAAALRHNADTKVGGMCTSASVPVQEGPYVQRLDVGWCVRAPLPGCGVFQPLSAPCNAALPLLLLRAG